MALNVKFLKGTQANFDALLNKDANTFYYIDNNSLYLGNLLLSNEAQVAEVVGNLALTNANLAELTERIDAELGSGTGSSIPDQLDALNTALTARIDANAAAIKDVQDDLASLQTDVIDPIGAKVDVLIGSDVNKSAYDIAISALAATLVAEDATEAYDTLEEVTAWIKAHPAEAAAMNAAITALQTADIAMQGDISTLQGAVADITDASSGILAESKGYTDSEIAKLSFDAAGTAATEAAGALTAAKDYTDEALTWGTL